MAQNASFLDFRDLSAQEILDLFSLAKKLKNDDKSFQPNLQGQTAGLLFFEPSTRTRFSFEAACARLGLYPFALFGSEGTSLEKGETFEDTVYNIAAMRPELLIVRCQDDLDLEELSENLPMPILNAGWGKRGHPTQTLLDTFTIWEQMGSAQKFKILFVGDIRHSRVVSSHFEMAKILGYEIGICAPSELLPQKTDGLKVFGDLSQGLSWCDVVMTLRVQKERHDNMILLDYYHDHFGLRPDNLKALSPNALILHPGPVNYGVELDKKVLKDPRTRILDQVTNGVFIRQAVIIRSLKAKGKL